jgi:hypothetical protein
MIDFMETELKSFSLQWVMLFKRKIMKFIKYMGILVISLFYTVTHAQTLTVGVVNVQQLLEQVPQAQAATLSLQNEFAEPQRELIAINLNCNNYKRPMIGMRLSWDRPKEPLWNVSFFKLRGTLRGSKQSFKKT